MMASNPVPAVLPALSTTQALERSSPDLSEQFFRGRPCDPWALKRKFPEQWRAFLHAHFRNPTSVAFTFGVCEKAAQNWWDGVGGPQGSKVALAFSRFPDEARAYLSEAA